MKTTLTTIVVGGKSQIKPAMELVSVLRGAGVKIKAIDPLGEDVTEIVKNTDKLDVLLVERHSSVKARIKLADLIFRQRLKCNLVMMELHKSDIMKTKFYSLFKCNTKACKEFNKVLGDYFNTHLRQPCRLRTNPIKYRLYLMKEALYDFTREHLQLRQVI
jgi:hypothetical protein